MRGMFTALITPFLKGAVDYDSLGSLIDFQLKSGVDGLVPCGTTGESPTLSHEEHEKVIEFTVKRAGGKVAVLAGTGSNSTQEAIRLTQHAKEIGASGSLQVSPYYNKPTQQGLIAHFTEIARRVDLDLVLYNIPGRTGVRIENDSLEILAREKNIVGVKDAVGDLDFTSETLSRLGEDFHILSGNDSQTFPMMCLGGGGVISVLSNVVPREVKALVDSLAKGEIDRGRAIHFRLWDLAKTLFIRTNPMPVKYAAYSMGLCRSPELRLPLNEIDGKDRERVDQALGALGLR